VLGNAILATASSSTKSSGSSFTFLIIIIVLFGVFYFVMWRPNSKRRRAMVDQQRQIVPGQQVRTTAGMYATVVSVDDDDVVLEVAPGVQSRFVRRAIMEVLPDSSTGEDFTMEQDDESATEADDVTDLPEHAEVSPNGSSPATDGNRAPDAV